MGLPNSPGAGSASLRPLATLSGPFLNLTLPSLSTKQMLADLIQFHPGGSLEEILSSSAPREQVSSQDSP